MMAGVLLYVLFMSTLIGLAYPLGWWIAQVYSDSIAPNGSKHWRIEKAIYRIAGVDPNYDMSWREYASATIRLSGISFVLVYAVQRGQAWLPWNPQQLSAVSPDSSFNTAVSFMTNTNWQGYSGEQTMSYGAQMLALTSQNFLSAAVGLAVLIALIRGLKQNRGRGLGNFWVDTTRAIIRLLVPLSVGLALVLISQGVVQRLSPSPSMRWLDPSPDQLTEYSLPSGPVASQVAIKQLGTNGGGFFNANSAHPIENPTPLSNFLQCLAILLIPASLCFSFGMLVGDRRQGWAMLVAMFLLFLPPSLLTLSQESRSQPKLENLGIATSLEDGQSGGNMEGKEVRHGVAASSLWAAATTAASNGSVNAMHSSFTPLGSLGLFGLMQIGEVAFGGVGSGLYGMILFAILTVFVAGLMVGRTPEYLGKKIGPFEMKMTVVAILLPCVSVLIGTAIAIVTPSMQTSLFHQGPHGFSEMLYAFSSTSNNNGSAFAGLNANTPWLNGTLGLAMLLGRFGVMIPVLAIAGSLAEKQKIPTNSGTLDTHSPLFVICQVAIVLIVGALTFFPALALGPIAESLAR